MSKKLPYDLDEHIDNIDAAIFTGDTFTSTENIDILQSFIDRWCRELVINRRVIQEEEDELQNNH